MPRVIASKKPVWITLAGALLFNLLLLSLQTSQPGAPGILRGWLLGVLTPAEKFVDWSVGGVWGIWDGYVALIGVRNENELLRSENARMQLQLADQVEDLREAERIRALLELKNSGIGKSVVARVIGRDPSHAHQTLTINKGEADGIEANTAVITADGVVGRVVFTSSASALVQLLTDPQNAVAVMVGPTRIQAVFKGTGGRELELDYVDDDNIIAEGDELITSGLDQIYPKGLRVGRVSSVGPRPEGGILKSVSVVPAADLGRIEEVLCIVEHIPAVPNPLEGPSGIVPSD